MLTLTVGFHPELVFSPSITPPRVTGLSFSMISTLSFLPGFMFLHTFYTFYPPLPPYFNSEVQQSRVRSFSQANIAGTETPAGMISRHAEWKLQHKLISVPLGGRALTLSHREPGIINSSGIVRGICMAIFTRHTYWPEWRL